MVTNQKRVDTTSADINQLGFEYQYLYFIDQLLHMRSGDEVGYEALDDVHVVSNAHGETSFIQVKHTTNLSAGGTPLNLTTLSSDLWKTLSNWSKLISDPAAQRENKDAQKAFVDNSKFILVTNRSISGNSVVTLADSIKKGNFSATDAKKELKNIRSTSTDKSIHQYIDDVLALSGTILLSFLKKIEFVTTDSNLFNKIRDGIRDKMVPEEDIDDVLCSLYTQLKEDFFKKVNVKTHQVLTYNEWQHKYQSTFNSVRRTLLPLREYHPALPDHLEQQHFAKELIEIGAIDLDDEGCAELIEFTEHYLSVKMQLLDWYEDGKIDRQTLDRFHDNARTLWKRIHRSCHRATKTDASLDRHNAITCFDQTMKEQLKILSTDLGISLSNGEFIGLANEEKIGWKYKWNL